MNSFQLTAFGIVLKNCKGEENSIVRKSILKILAEFVASDFLNHADNCTLTAERFNSNELRAITVAK